MRKHIVGIIHYIYDEKLLTFNRANAANYITLLGSWLSRLGLYLFIVYFAMYWYNDAISTTAQVVRIAAIVLLVLGSICDAIDGYVSRKLGIVSTFGELFDPHHDKVQYVTKTQALILDAVVSLMSGASPAFIIQAIVIGYVSMERDLAVMFHRMWAIRESPTIKIRAESSGKWRTRICFPGILFMFIVVHNNLVWVGWMLTVIILTVTFYSNWEYVRRYRAGIIAARDANS